MKNLILILVTFVTLNNTLIGQTFEWGYGIGGLDSDYLTDITFDQNGFLYITGNFNGTVDFDPGVGVSNLTTTTQSAYLAKYSSAGVLQWVIKPSATTNGIEIINSNIYYYGKNSNNQWLMHCYNLSGVLVWEKLFGVSGTNVDSENSKLITKDIFNNIYITGSSHGSMNFETGNSNAQLSGKGYFFVKFNTSFNCTLAKLIPTAPDYVNIQIFIYPLCIHVDINQNIYLTGQYGMSGSSNTGLTFDFDPGPGNTNTTFSDYGDLFFVKYTSSGNYDWMLSGGVSNFSPDRGTSITSDSQGNIYLAGSFVYQIDLDPGPGTHIVSTNVSAWDGARGFIAKYTNTGNILWGYSIQSYNSYEKLFVDNNNNLYFFAHMSRQTDFDLGPGVFALDSVHKNTFGFAKYTPQGQIVWAKLFHSNTNVSRAINVRNNGDIFLGGEYNVSIALNADNLSDTIINNGYYGPETYSRDFFISKYKQSPSILSQSQDINICLNDSMILHVEMGGAPPYSYQWKKNGIDISGATFPTYIVPNVNNTHEATYTCYITNDYGQITSNPIVVKIISLTLNAGTDKTACKGTPVQLLATGNSNHPSYSGTLSYVWTPTAGLNNPNINNPMATSDTTITYIVSLSDQNACQITDTLVLNIQKPYNNQKICLVTVDSLTGKNKVIWEKTPNVGTEYYIIYKESGTNNYIQCGNVDATQTAEFIDYFSQPDVHGDKYKIAVLDTCGNESDLSPYHKTINLTIAAFGSTMGLNWDKYIDESGDYVPFRYYIFRGTNPANMTLLDSVSGSFSSYNDNNVTTLYYYKIGVKKTGGCNSSKSEMLAFSNNIDNSSLIGIDELELSNKAIIVFPNPFTESTILRIPTAVNTPEDLQLKVYDITGKLLIINKGTGNFKSSEHYTEIEFNRAHLASGMYYIEIIADMVYRARIIIE